MNMALMGLIFTIFCIPWDENGDPLYFSKFIINRGSVIMNQIITHCYAFVLLYSSRIIMLTIFREDKKICCGLKVILLVLVNIASCIVSFMEEWVYFENHGWIFIVSCLSSVLQILEKNYISGNIICNYFYDTIGFDVLHEW